MPQRESCAGPEVLHDPVHHRHETEAEVPAQAGTCGGWEECRQWQLSRRHAGGGEIAGVCRGMLVLQRWNGEQVLYEEERDGEEEALRASDPEGEGLPVDRVGAELSLRARALPMRLVLS